MRNYTSPKEKVEKYSIKYNLPKEEVKRILSTQDADLTKNELIIKYNNENIGKIPDWITEEELYKIISKTAGDMYRKHYRFFVNWIQPQELFNELYLYVLCTRTFTKKLCILKNRTS